VVTARTFRILLVDDYQLAKVLVRKALENIGVFEVSEADDGKAALHLIREAHQDGKPFDLVLCDWNMPILNGLELLQLIRKYPEFAFLQFVMVTSAADQQHVLKALNHGAVDYVIKPIAPGVIEKKVQKIFNKLKKGA
jgi:two-component system chemotaxis response regulator CheY